MKKKNENILYQIIQALRQIHEGDPPMVWLTFSKNILEAAFDAFCAVYFIKYSTFPAVKLVQTLDISSKITI